MRKKGKLMKFWILLLCLIPCAAVSAVLEKLIFRVKGGWFWLLVKNYVFVFVFYYGVHLLTMDRPLSFWKELLITIPLSSVALGLVIKVITLINDRINEV